MQLTPTKLGIAVLLAFSSIGIAVGIPQVLCGGPPSVTCIMRPKTKDCILKLYKLDPFPWPLLKQSDPVPETANFDFTIHGYDGPGEYLCSVVCPDGNATNYTKIELTTGTYPNPLMEGFTNPPSTAQPTNLPANTQSSTDQESSTTGGPPTTFLQYLTSATNPPNTAQPTTSPATAQPTTVQAQTTPGQTTPVQTTPAQTTPGQTTPAQTTPVQTTPAQTTPGQTTPVQTTPAQTTPAQTTPVQTTPAQTTPAQTTPAQTTPATTTPATTEPPPDPCKCKEAKGDDVPCLRQKGKCESISRNSCDAGNYPASNFPQLCPFGRICCVPADNGTKTCKARDGKCQDADDNMIKCKDGKGYYQTGLCPGDLNIQCCLPFS